MSDSHRGGGSGNSTNNTGQWVRTAKCMTNVLQNDAASDGDEARMSSYWSDKTKDRA
jgi:hypothetical protein